MMPSTYQVTTRSVAARCQACGGYGQTTHTRETPDLSEWWEERCLYCQMTGLDPIPLQEVMS